MKIVMDNGSFHGTNTSETYVYDTEGQIYLLGQVKFAYLIPHRKD